MKNVNLLDVLFRIKDNIVALDNNFTITYANQAFADTVGFKVSDMLGKNIWIILPQAVGTTVYKKTIDAMAKKEITHFEWQGVYAKSFLETTIFPSDNGLTIISRDITIRKKAEEALKESEQHFRLVAEAAKVMVYETNVISSKAKVIRGSEELVGFKPNEVDYSVDWVLSRIHPDDLANVLEHYKEALKGGVEGYSVKYRFLHKNGKYITVQDTAKAIRDSYGKTVRMIGGVYDVSEREADKQRIEQYSKHLEKLVEERTVQLRQKERLAAIGETVGMVGHDVRNPLQAIVSDVYLLKDYLTSMPDSKMKTDVAESLEGIEKNVSYVNKIVADLQDYTRVIKPECLEVNLYGLIIDVFQTISIPEKVEPFIKVEPSLILKTDPVLVKRILSNLIINAIQAMPNGGKIELSANQTKGEVEICVSDTGVGIPNEVKAKLFTPLMTTKAQGQGLGLAVVKRLVQTLNGTISFESEIGRGTKFTVNFPTIT